MSRALLHLALLATLALTTQSRAQPWVDLGPSLGLPSQLQGPSGPSLSAGITAADLDGDGRLELITSTPTLGLVVYTRVGATFQPTPDLLPNVLTTGGVFGHTLFDADGDGDLDLFVARDDKDRLYLYDAATSTFADASDTHLPRLLGWHASATAVDLDGDGDLDLLLARYIDRVDFPAHRCFANHVFTNDGRGVFTDTTPPTMAATRGCSFAIVAADYDDDLDLDLIVVNDFAQFTGRMELWENRGFTQAGALDLVEVSAERGLVAPLYGMGAAFDDLDQDGHPELMLTNIGEPLLFTRAPDLTFRSTNTDKNLYARFAWDRLQATWTTRFLDLDGDGHLDVLSAGGALPAAPFIGNPPDQGSVILRGQPSGGLDPIPLAIDLPRAGHSARDFELADLTGDGLDELLVVHVHGRISVFENLERRGNRTRVELRPSTTGKNAAGARLSLTCAGITRTRRINAGGDYGVHDRPRTELSFPPPCAKNMPASGLVHWPSGLVQAFDTTIGATLTLTEPAWFTLTPEPASHGSPDTPSRRGTLTLDLAAHELPFEDVVVTAQGLTVSALTEVSPRRYTATWELSDPNGGRFDLFVDGTPWGLHPRVPGTTPELSLTAIPVAGRTARVRLAFAGSGWPGPVAPTTATATLLSPTALPITIELIQNEPGLLVGALPLPANPGTYELHVTWDPEAGDPQSLDVSASSLTRPLEVMPLVSEDDSELVVRELHILQAERLTRRVRMRARLHDANHESSPLPLDALGLLLDGVPVEPDLRSIEAGFLTVGIEHSRLAHGSVLTLTIDGVPHFSPQRVAQVERPDEFGALASAERSRCWFSEPRARADGEDIITALMQFADEAGARLPDTGLSPTLTTDRLRVAPASLELGYGGWRVDLIAGTEVGDGTLEARLPGMDEAIRCQLALVTPPELPDPATNSTLVSLTANPVVGQSITVRIWPLGPDGRSLGSGVPLTLETSENAVATPVVYIGQGRYQSLVTPRAAGPVVLQAVRSDGAIIAATTLWEVGTPPDESPEPGPESVESDDPEPLEPDLEETSPDPEETSSEEPGSEATELSPEPVEPVEQVEQVEPVEPDPDPDPTETGAPDTLEPDPERRPRDQGCGLARGPTPLILGLLGLLGAQLGPSRRARARSLRGTAPR